MAELSSHKRMRTLSARSFDTRDVYHHTEIINQPLYRYIMKEPPTTDPLLAPLTPLTGQGYTWLSRWLMRDIGPDAVGGFIHGRRSRDCW